MNVEQPITIDLLDNQSAAPALSSTSDLPIVETKPDARPAAEQEATEQAAPDEGTTTSESSDRAGE